MAKVSLENDKPINVLLNNEGTLNPTLKNENTIATTLSNDNNVIYNQQNNEQIEVRVNDLDNLETNLVVGSPLNTTVTDINYIPDYKIAEQERRANEIIRQENEADRIALYEDMQQKLESGYFKGEKGDKGEPGTTDYLDLSNKPQINGVTLIGNKTSSDLGIVGDKNYLFTQNVASDTWVIEHNLNKYPSVSVVDSAGDEVVGEITYNSINQLTIKFEGAFKGAASLN